MSVSLENETVWLSSNQMALLFDRDEKTVRKHVNNVFKENELDKENNTQKMRVDGCKRIAASIFLEFLERNDALFRNEEKVISDGALVAITLSFSQLHFQRVLHHLLSGLPVPAYPKETHE